MNETYDKSPSKVNSSVNAKHCGLSPLTLNVSVLSPRFVNSSFIDGANSVTDSNLLRVNRNRIAESNGGSPNLSSNEQSRLISSPLAVPIPTEDAQAVRGNLRTTMFRVLEGAVLRGEACDDDLLKSYLSSPDDLLNVLTVFSQTIDAVEKLRSKVKFIFNND